jgi:hypothetical protein
MKTSVKLRVSPWLEFLCVYPAFLPGQQHLLFPPQISAKIRDISEKNSTTKSKKSKKEEEERVLS